MPEHRALAEIKEEFRTRCRVPAAQSAFDKLDDAVNRAVIPALDHGIQWDDGDYRTFVLKCAHELADETSDLVEKDQQNRFGGQVTAQTITEAVARCYDQWMAECPWQEASLIGGGAEEAGAETRAQKRAARIARFGPPCMNLMGLLARPA